MYRNDITNKRFERLTVIKFAGVQKDRKSTWLCKCDCGREVIVSVSNLVYGKQKSCGCLKNERISLLNKKHGLRNTRLYRIWLNMKNRCLNSKSLDWENYGGRGITVCNEWRNNFQAFYDWAMANGYADNLTIDRIDNNGNYEPANCRWADIFTQENNRRNNKKYEYNGEVLTLPQIAKKYNISRSNLANKVY